MMQLDPVADGRLSQFDAALLAWTKSAEAGFRAAWSAPVLGGVPGKLLLIGVVLMLCLVRAYIGLVGSRLFSHDAFMLFDGAWRMMNGQRPHIDFYSHVGVLTYVPTVAGLWLAHGTAWSFGYGQALAGLLLAAWAYLLGRDRMADVPLALMCVTVAFVSVAPFAPGYFVFKMGSGTTYNRFGYALISLLLLEAVCGPKGMRPRSDFWGGVSTGLILVTTLFLKITYFGVAALLIVVLLPCLTQKRARWIGMASALLVALLVFCGYFGFSMGPMVRDLTTIAGGKHIFFPKYMLDEIVQHAITAVALAGAVALLWLSKNSPGKALSAAIAGIAVAFCGMVLILGNSEQSGFPLLAFLAIILLNELVLVEPEHAFAPDYFQSSVLLLGSAFILGLLFSSAAGTVSALAGRVVVPRVYPPFRSPILSGFVPMGDDYLYTGFVNDGLDLVRKFRRPGDTIMSLDFTNPFSYGLGMKPAPGGTTVLQYNTTFNDRFRPSAKSLFGAAELVAVPKTFSDGSLEGNVERLYGPYLRSHFSLVGESASWLLYRRNRD